MKTALSPARIQGNRLIAFRYGGRMSPIFFGGGCRRVEQYHTTGAFSSKQLHNNSLPNTEPEELFSFLMEELMDESDMLTTKQAAELTGYNDTTINNWVADGKIQAVNYYGKNLISKESLAEYLSSLEGQRIARPSQKHQEIIEAYTDREQKSGMAFGSMSLR